MPVATDRIEVGEYYEVRGTRWKVVGPVEGKPNTWRLVKNYSVGRPSYGKSFRRMEIECTTEEILGAQADVYARNASAEMIPRIPGWRLKSGVVVIHRR